MLPANWEQVNPVAAIELILTLKKQPVVIQRSTDNYIPEFDQIFEEALEDLDRKARSPSRRGSQPR